eukprot:150826_1
MKLKGASGISVKNKLIAVNSRNKVTMDIQLETMSSMGSKKYLFCKSQNECEFVNRIKLKWKEYEISNKTKKYKKTNNKNTSPPQNKKTKKEIQPNTQPQTKQNKTTQ